MTDWVTARGEYNSIPVSAWPRELGWRWVWHHIPSWARGLGYSRLQGTQDKHH